MITFKEFLIQEGFLDKVKGFFGGGGQEFTIAKTKLSTSVEVVPYIEKGSSNFRIQLEDKSTIPVGSKLTFQLTGMNFWINGIMGQNGIISSSSDIYSKYLNAINNWWAEMSSSPTSKILIPSFKGQNITAKIKWENPK